MKTNGNDSISPRKVLESSNHPMLPDEYVMSSGLTKREYFAAMALNGLLANNMYNPSSGLCDSSVRAADALIEALNKE